MYIYWFSSDLRAVKDADDDDNAGHHGSTNRATYRQLGHFEKCPIDWFAGRLNRLHA